jgi:hypothetical protein
MGGKAPPTRRGGKQSQTGGRRVGYMLPPSSLTLQEEPPQTGGRTWIEMGWRGLHIRKNTLVLRHPRVL